MHRRLLSLATAAVTLGALVVTAQTAHRLRVPQGDLHRLHRRGHPRCLSPGVRPPRVHRRRGPRLGEHRRDLVLVGLRLRVLDHRARGGLARRRHLHDGPGGRHRRGGASTSLARAVGATSPPARSSCTRSLAMRAPASSRRSRPPTPPAARARCRPTSASCATTPPSTTSASAASRLGKDSTVRTVTVTATRPPRSSRPRSRARTPPRSASAPTPAPARPSPPARPARSRSGRTRARWGAAPHCCACPAPRATASSA